MEGSVMVGGKDVAEWVGEDAGVAEDAAEVVWQPEDRRPSDTKLSRTSGPRVAGP